jgi:hypothetical protein
MGALRQVHSAVKSTRLQTFYRYLKPGRHQYAFLCKAAKEKD